MEPFWDSSWERMDVSQAAAYAENFDMGEDNMIEALRRYHAQTVCDAGCGCGLYALKLAANGFDVGGFDVSARAAKIAGELVRSAGYAAPFKAASVLATGYADGQFDAVVCRGVLDHISKADATLAVQELCRITKPGGVVLFTLDALDEEYRTEPHAVHANGDYVYTAGKWQGMVFHPYTLQEVDEMLPPNVESRVTENQDGLTVMLVCGEQ